MFFTKKPKPRPRTPVETEIDDLKSRTVELSEKVDHVRFAIDQLAELAGGVLQGLNELREMHERREAVAALRGVQDVQAREKLN